MSYWEMMQEIDKLPHYREFDCRKCGRNQKVFVLLIQHKCENCGTSYELRGLGLIGTEVEDVIDSVLEWLGTGDEFEEAMMWKQLRENYQDKNNE